MSNYNTIRTDINARRNKSKRSYNKVNRKLPPLLHLKSVQEIYQTSIKKGVTYLYKDGEIIGMEKN